MAFTTRGFGEELQQRLRAETGQVIVTIKLLDHDENLIVFTTQEEDVFQQSVDVSEVAVHSAIQSAHDHIRELMGYTRKVQFTGGE